MRSIVFFWCSMSCFTACSVKGQYDDTSFRCDDGKGCPIGYECHATGMCLVPGTEPTDAPPGCVDITKFVDDFEDGLPIYWSPFSTSKASVEESDGKLIIHRADRSPQNHFAGYRSQRSYDMREQSVTIEVTRIDSSSSAARASFKLYSQIGTSLFIEQTNAQIRFGTQSSGNEEIIHSEGYDASLHRVWSIREQADIITFETSADGAAFVAKATVPSTAYVDSLRIELSGGTHTRVTTPGQVHFDNLNGGVSVDPACD